MSVMNLNSTAPSLRRLPFTVKLSPQFVNRLLSYTPAEDSSRDNVYGLLFGTSSESLVVVQAFQLLTDAGKEDRVSASQDETFEKLLAAARKDPEISPLELVGWYKVRAN